MKSTRQGKRRIQCKKGEEVELEREDKIREENKME